jgi:tetratricopeptide (TPR) repeat protein
MTNVERTVFLSYRRDTSSYLARAIYQDLRHNGYDVFMDVESIDSGTFDTIILGQIAARTHFIVILEPGSEKRLAERGDWLRREVERAIELGRNVVPILAGNFSFSDATPYLKGKLAELPKYNGVPLHRDYFEEAMERLRSRFLKKPVSVSAVETPTAEREIVKRKASEIDQLPKPTKEQFSIEFYINRGNEKLEKGDLDGAAQDYAQVFKHEPEDAVDYIYRCAILRAIGNHDLLLKEETKLIELMPDTAEFYNQRGLTYLKLGKSRKAIKDFGKAIALDSEYAQYYFARGLAFTQLGKHRKATKEYGKAVELDPDLVDAYEMRASSYGKRGKYGEAISDYNQVIALQPDNSSAYRDRGSAYSDIGQHERAIEDLDKAISLDPNDELSYRCRALAYGYLDDFDKAEEDSDKADALRQDLVSK